MSGRLSFVVREIEGVVGPGPCNCPRKALVFKGIYKGLGLEG